ncbi:MAG: rRNA maturation RNase YbeY [Rikenellaceae bacterium]
MAIRYFNDNCTYRFVGRRTINRWLREVAQSEGYRVLDIGVIFCSAERLLAMNREFLQHDYYTDIITFDDSDLEGGVISGELFIDVETVADNATLYGSTPLREMHRILVHGTLHLCGQGDKSLEDSVEMRAKEDRYLSLLDAIVEESSSPRI